MVFSKQLMEPLHWAVHSYKTLVSKQGSTLKLTEQLLFNKKYLTSPWPSPISEADLFSLYRARAYGDQIGMSLLPFAFRGVVEQMQKDDLDFQDAINYIIGNFGHPIYPEGRKTKYYTGDLNEDIDNDNHFDQEETSRDINVMRFNYYNTGTGIRRDTYQGIGIMGWETPYKISEGNGMIDDEDMNNNGTLEKSERFITYPSADTTGVFSLTKKYFLVFSSNFANVTNFSINNDKETNIGIGNYLRLTNFNTETENPDGLNLAAFNMQ